MYCLTCLQVIHMHFLKHMHFLLAQFSGTAKVVLLLNATLKNFQEHIMLLCWHTQNVMNNILKVHIINLIIFIQWRSWENLVLKNFDKNCRQHLCKSPRGHAGVWLQTKTFLLFYAEFNCGTIYLWKWVLSALPQPHQKTGFLWRLADMPCAHRDFGQQKARFKEDKTTLQEKQRREKQSFLAKCSNERVLPAAVTHLCRSGFMLLPVSFMLAL